MSSCSASLGEPTNPRRASLWPSDLFLLILPVQLFTLCRLWSRGPPLFNAVLGSSPCPGSFVSDQVCSVLREFLNLVRVACYRASDQVCCCLREFPSLFDVTCCCVAHRTNDSRRPLKEESSVDRATLYLRHPTHTPPPTSAITPKPPSTREVSFTSLMTVPQSSRRLSESSSLRVRGLTEKGC